MSDEQKYQHDKDFTILTIQLGYINESQGRIEKTIHELKGEWKKDIDRLSVAIDKVDEKHSRDIEDIKKKIADSDLVNSNFRTKVTAYATVGSIIGGGVWQIIFYLITR